MFRQFGTQKVCVNGTHGLDKDGRILYTVLFIGEFGNGVPVSSAISKRKDTSFYSLYFSIIKEAWVP